MSKRLQAVLATMVMILFAFASFPSSSVSTRIDSPKAPDAGDDGSQSRNSEAGKKATVESRKDSKKGVAEKAEREEVQVQLAKLREEHNVAMEQWQKDRDSKPRLEADIKVITDKIAEEAQKKPESDDFEEREWVTEDGKYKTVATLIDSDFKIAKLKRQDGSVVEVSKEKLCAADKQAIERAFAVIEVAARKEKEWIDRLAKLDEEKRAIEAEIELANRPAPQEPTLEQASALADELRKNDAAEKTQREIAEAEEKGLIHPSSIEILEVRVVERKNANGQPMDMIECKFKNNSKRTVRIIDCTYLAFDEKGKEVLSRPYTLYAVDNTNKGVKPGEWYDTVRSGHFLPKTIGAKSAKVVVTKVLERDSSTQEINGQSVESVIANFATIVNSRAEAKYIASIQRRDDTLIIEVQNTWHFLPYQIRYQMAQNLWQAWAMAYNPEVLDHARIEVKDLNGNSVGGSRILGGSLIWVSK
jgi:hypothetical protein